MDSKTDPTATLDHLFRSQSRYQERLRRVEDEGRQEEMLGLVRSIDVDPRRHTISAFDINISNNQEV